jgi:hypothetical protein
MAAESRRASQQDFREKSRYMNGFLYHQNIWLVYGVTIALFAGAAALGFWLGRRFGACLDDKSASQFSTVQGAILGLLGLLLAFTFAMAASRYDARKQLVIDESNAIGTAYLRAQVLPEPHRAAVGALLREYTAVRLLFFEAGVDPVKLRSAIEHTQQLQDRLWEQAVAISRQDVRAVTSGLFLESLNEVFDLHARRLAALENRVPEVILLLLYVVAVVTIAMLGYGAGLGERRSLVPAFIALFLVATILLTIIDLDRPRRGLIQVSQRSMLSLQESLKEPIQ